MCGEQSTTPTMHHCSSLGEIPRHVHIGGHLDFFFLNYVYIGAAIPCIAHPGDRHPMPLFTLLWQMYMYLGLAIYWIQPDCSYFYINYLSINLMTSVMERSIQVQN